MKNKTLLFATILLTAALLIIGYMVFQDNKKGNSLADAISIVVTDVKRVDFDTCPDSNIVWIPGKKSSVATLYSHMERNNAVEFTYHQETSVYAYNLNTGESSEIYNLWNYGISKGNGVNFFWSENGNRLVTDIGGVVDLERKTGNWISLPKEYQDINVIGTSPDGETLLVEGAGDKSGLFIIDIDNNKHHLFNMQPSIFSSPFKSLSWSANGEWVAAQSYDPDHTPKDVFEALNAPRALYLLRIDGQEVRLIARNIYGNINSVVFSPDGNKLVWVVSQKNNDQFVYVANIDGSGVHEIFSNASMLPEYKIASNILWSPDGSQLVYVGYHGNQLKCPFWILTLGHGGTGTQTK